MSETATNKARVDPRVYVANRSKFLPEDLRPYSGQWVAWSADGSRIVAHHNDLEQVVREVEQAGLQREDVVFNHLPMNLEVDFI